MRKRESERREEIKTLENFPSISLSSNAHSNEAISRDVVYLSHKNGYNTISRDEIWDLNSMSESRSLNEIVELRISPMISSRQLSNQSTLEWRKKNLFLMLEIDFVLFSLLPFFPRFSHGSHKKLTICFDIFSHLPHTFLFFRCDTINSSSGFGFDKKFIYRLHRSHMGHGRLSGGKEVEGGVKSSKFFYGLELNKDFFSFFISCTQFTIVRSQIFPQLSLSLRYHSPSSEWQRRSLFDSTNFSHT